MEPIAQQPPLTLDYQTPGSVPRPTRLIPIVEAIAHVAFGVILPIVCFLMSAKSYPGVDRPWQSGELRMYLGLIPRAVCAWPFYPLLLFSMGSLLVAVTAPARAAAQPIVGLGIYTGIILALQFSVIQLACIAPNKVVMALAFAGTILLVGVYELLRWLIRRFHRAMRLVGLVLLAIAAIGVMVAGLLGELPEAVLAPAFTSLFVAPMLTLATYAAVARVMFSNAERPNVRWLWASWLGAYSAAWWASIIRVLDVYSTLPQTRPSGCYVVTAAAGGHPWLVRSTHSIGDDGSIAVSSTQLRRLKLAELLLARGCPRAHRNLRHVYDRVGPPLAHLIRAHPLFCDLAYCSLKPAEWTAIVILRLAASAPATPA